MPCWHQILFLPTSKPSSSCTAAAHQEVDFAKLASNATPSKGIEVFKRLVSGLCSIYKADIATASYLGEDVLHIALVVITVNMYNINTSCFPAIIQIAVCCCSSVSGAIV
jgi:hypothetical protein